MSALDRLRHEGSQLTWGSNPDRAVWDTHVKVRKRVMTMAILKLRLQATLEFCTFQTRLRAPATASKHETPVKHTADHAVTCPCEVYAAVTADADGFEYSSHAPLESTIILG